MFSLREVDLGPAGEVVQATIRAGAELERENAFAVGAPRAVENDAALLADDRLARPRSAPAVSPDRGVERPRGEVERRCPDPEPAHARRCRPARRGSPAHRSPGEPTTIVSLDDQQGDASVTSHSWQNQKGSGGTVEVHRIIEVATVLLLALATVGSAWCAYQVSQWNGRETDAARVSAAARIDGSREYALATQKVAYDAASVAQYAEAVVAGERAAADVPADLDHPARVPPDRSTSGRPIIDETGKPPPNLVEDEEYLAGPVRGIDHVRRGRRSAATLEGDEAGRQRRRLHRDHAVHGERAVLRRCHRIVREPFDADRAAVDVGADARLRRRAHRRLSRRLNAPTCRTRALAVGQAIELVTRRRRIRRSGRVGRASSTSTTSVPLTAGTPSGADERPAVAGERVVRVDLAGAAEHVAGEVGEHGVGHRRDAVVARPFERRVEHGSRRRPHRGDQVGTASRVGFAVRGEVGVDGRPTSGAGGRWMSVVVVVSWS